MNKPILIGVLTLLVNLVLFTSSLAQCDSIGWSNDPSVNLNVSSWGQSPRVVSDGQGGVFIMWQINSFNTFQYLQHVDRCGIIQWPAPVVVRGEWNGCRFYPDLAQDGSGGALVSYTEQNVSGPQPGEGRVRVNRMDESGNLLWGPYGVRVSLLEQNQSSISKVVPDGEGGAIVSFGIPWDSLYIQHISATGERLWGDEGILLTTESHPDLETHLIPDSLGGAIVEWYEFSPNFEIYLKRFNYQGNLLYTTFSPIFYTRMIPDGNGGAVLGGEDRTSVPIKIIANRLSPNGELVWGQNGLIIQDSLSTHSGITDAILRADSTVVVYWTEVYNPVNDFDIFTQFVSTDGSLIFPENIPISTVDSNKGGNRAILSNANSVIYTWSDYRSGDKSRYAQKLDTSGYQLWNNVDILVTNRNYGRSSIISDMRYGIILVWEEAPLNGIFVQQISKNGNLGEIITGLVHQSGDKIPHDHILFQNYPNPFNPATTIEYQLPFDSKVKIEIYNILGQRVKTLIDRREPAGKYKIIWDGRNDYGSRVASGLYVYRIKADTNDKIFVKSKKMILLK